MRKALAWILSLAMMAALFVLPASYTVSADAAPEHVYYVSSSGNDANAGTEAAPFATIAKAQTELAALEDAETAIDGTIYVSGTVDFVGGVSHKGVHTIEGLSNTPTVRSNGAYVSSAFSNASILGGPMIFDSVKFAWNNSAQILTNGYPVEINNCGAASSLQMFFGNYNHAVRENVVVRNWTTESKYLDPYIAAFGPGTSNTSPGCDIIFDGGIKYVNLGKSGITSTFNGDVNVTFNSGATAVNTYTEGTNTLNGALQMVFNNGVTVNSSKDAMANVSAVGGVWRLFGAAGSYLETTATAGTFRVPGGYTATATNRSGGAQIDSVGGYLTLPAGIYDFECELHYETIEASVYVSDSGDDENAGTEAAPFATIDKAKQALAAMENAAITVDGTIFVSGTVNFASDVSHKGVHTIKGVSGTTPTIYPNPAYLNDTIKNVVILQGPTVFDSVAISAGKDNSRRIVTNGYPVEFNNCSAPGSYTQLYIGNYNHAVRENVVVKNWTTESKYLDPYIAAFGPGTSNTSPGCDIVFDGGVKYVNLGKSGFTSTFNGDVNVTFNSGATAVNTYIEGTNTLNGALQMVFNNGVTVNSSKNAMGTVTAADGAWWLFGTTGSYLETTATAGTFKVVPEGFTATATNRSGGAQVTSVNGYLTLPAGTYDFVCTTTVDTVYVSESGSDSNNGLTSATPFATINKAEALLSASTAETKTIMVSGTVNFDGGIAHSDMIEIVGQDSSAILVPSGYEWVNYLDRRCTLFKGPTTFRSIQFTKSGSHNSEEQLITNGFEVKLIDCKTPGSDENLQFYIGKPSGDNTDHDVFTISNYKESTIDDYIDLYFTTFGNESAGADIYVPDATGVRYLTLGKKSTATTNYTGNVNIELNGNTPVNEIKTYITGTVNIDGAFQFICNNNIAANLSTTKNDFADMDSKATVLFGCYYMYSSDKQYCGLAATEDPGIFRIKGGLAAKATNRDDDSIVYYGVGEIEVEEPGVYDVEYYSLGDVNFSGSFDIIDLIVAKKLIAGSAYREQADLSTDGSLNADDLTLIIRELLGTNAQSKITEAAAPAVMSFSETGGYDTQAAAKKASILNHATASVSAATTYYVSSSDGSDSNNGLSAQTPFKTIAKVNTLSAGTSSSRVAVLFKRGDTFRTTTPLTVKSYTTYSSYGTGAKPILSGSYQNFADPSLWTLENLSSIWSANVSASAYDIANVVFNEAFSAVRKQSISDLAKDGDFFYDSTANKLYLYLMNYNPGHYYDSIEVHSSVKVANGDNVTGVNMADLSFKFAAKHGVDMTKAIDFQISNCEIGWIGGIYYNTETGVRMGNGIQLWNHAENATITDCYIYQVFDAAVTFQGNKNDKYDDVLISNNLIEYSTYGLEFWGSSSVEKMKDIVFTGNILRFIGSGYSSQRHDRSDAFITSSAFDMTTSYLLGLTYNDVVISNNVFDCGNAYYLCGREIVADHMIFSGNTYYQKPGCSRMVRRLTSGETGEEIYAVDLASFTSGIRQFDSNGTVNWIAG